MHLGYKSGLNEIYVGSKCELTDYSPVLREESLALDRIYAAADTVVSPVFPVTTLRSRGAPLVVYAAVVPVPSPAFVIPSGHAHIESVAVTKSNS